MLNGTAKVSVTDYDEGGFVINDVNMRGGVALYPEIAMVRLAIVGMPDNAPPATN